MNRHPECGHEKRTKLAADAKELSDAMGKAMTNTDKLIERLNELNTLIPEDEEAAALIGMVKEYRGICEQLSSRLKAAEGEVKRLNQWADDFTDQHLKERQIGDALIKETLGKLQALESVLRRIEGWDCQGESIKDGYIDVWGSWPFAEPPREEE